jgi:heterodisulfide reductase subunit A-like polyferredoxin/coenzyme F420-reducing hydrogenase delta subunit
MCDCGDQVAGVLDVAALVEAARGWPGVAWSGRARYGCSAEGREGLAGAIRREGLNRVVVAGCSPRTHRRLFEAAAEGAGLDPSLVGIVNVREGCAWPHRDEPQAATRRARDQIAMEAARLGSLAPHPPRRAEILPSALVVGGGVAGLTAALELAGAGIPVTLVERTPRLGGQAIAGAPELAAELAAAAHSHPSIQVHLNSRAIDVEGSVGAYHVAIAETCEAETSTAQYAARPTFGAIILATGPPDAETSELARLLRLPQDAQGFLPEQRLRLRPGAYVERGIYVCGEVHYPCGPDEAGFQGYSAASRALRYLRRGRVTAAGPAARVDPGRCNGCGDCFKACPFAAVSMAPRPGDHEPIQGLSLAAIDPLLCTGCGDCVSVCPVGAVSLPGWSDTALEAQMRVALNGALAPAHDQPRALVFACEWSGYAAAELAGARGLTYPSSVRLIRLDCSGRLGPGLILKAFEMGAAGVLVLGCAPGLCHYERGNERAAVVADQVGGLTHLLGLAAPRFQIAWTPPDDGAAFAELVTGFVKEVGSRE